LARDAGAVRSRRLQLRLDGYLAAENAHASRVLDVQIGGGAMQKFALVKLVVLSGNASPGDIIERVRPYKPSFRFTGDAALLERISAAKPDELLHIRGAFGTGDRIYLVSAVESGAAPVPTPGTRHRHVAPAP
ncbi:MAG TPA: hypothetical protein VEI94_08870, partial [Candidatus Bathyarchaeia archaeon]|nr:hypothetical protein [Candidatus Bathyarchaeia archaeon]